MSQTHAERKARSRQVRAKSCGKHIYASAVQDLIDYADSALHYVNQCMSRDKATHAANGTPKSEPISAVVAAGLSSALTRLGIDPKKGTQRIWRVFQLQENNGVWRDVHFTEYGRSGTNKRIVIVVESEYS